MKISIICFSREGAALAERAASFYKNTGREAAVYTSSNHAEEFGMMAAEPDLKTWTKQQFQNADAILFIGACGIAVRAIAPWIVSKDRDPAVLVLDDGGRFLISLLSGHLGGANALTEELAAKLGAQPVVTTATDRKGIWAVDSWAKKNGCCIMDMKLAKEVSARLIHGEKVGFYSQFPILGNLPDGLVHVKERDEDLPIGVAVGIQKFGIPKEENIFERTLELVPRIMTIGMGCRKNTEKETLERAVDLCLEIHGFYKEAVKQIASVDLKKEEPGLLQLCKEREWDFLTYPAQQLNELEGDFTKSSFVRQVAGVDCVCERAAVCASDGGRLLVKKSIFQGVTAAIAVPDWKANFL